MSDDCSNIRTSKKGTLERGIRTKLSEIAFKFTTPSHTLHVMTNLCNASLANAPFSNFFEMFFTPPLSKELSPRSRALTQTFLSQRESAGMTSPGNTRPGTRPQIDPGTLLRYLLTGKLIYAGWPRFAGGLGVERCETEAVAHALASAA